MEWTTENEARTHEAASNGESDTQPLPVQPGMDSALTPSELPAPPLPPVSYPPPIPPVPSASPTPPAAPIPPVPTRTAPVPAQPANPAAPGGFEHCPSCGALVANDQRYCLECGQRRGDPRLPFMDAVVFMDAMNRPPEPASAPKKRRRGISPNTALIAGVGTLLLALGIGVLIGRSGNHSTASAPAPQVVTVSGGGEEAKTPSAGTTSASGSGGGKTKNPKAKQKAEEAKPGGSASNILPSNPNVNLPPPKVEIGEKCEKQVAGCSKNGKFEGTFFGE